jgi:phage terminase large subunit GpA-like protein
MQKTVILIISTAQIMLSALSDRVMIVMILTVIITWGLQPGTTTLILSLRAYVIMAEKKSVMMAIIMTGHLKAFPGAMQIPL